MAIQHVSIKNGSRGNGAKHALYVAGEGRYADKEDEIRHVEDGNLPKWAKDAVAFFGAADELERGDYTKKAKTQDGIEYEKLVRGRAYKEVEAAIPREAKDPVQWAKDYARELLGDKHPYRLAVHDKPAGGGGRNVHMHLMFSTRTMDGHDREKETFFKRAASAYRNPKTKELVQRDPASGGAVKSAYWNSRESIDKTRSAFERHVQRAAPDFKMERSEAPEPKIGPILKRAGKEYEAGRSERIGDVAHMRQLKMVRGLVNKELEKEVALERGREKPVARTDDLWAKLTGKKEPEREREQPAKPDWSKFRETAGAKATEDNTRKGQKMEPNSGPGYFPETKQERERNKEEANAFQRLEQQQKEGQQQPTRTDDLWAQMQRDREGKEQADRGRDSGPDWDM